MCNGWRLWLILGHSGNGGVVVVFEILWVPPPPSGGGFGGCLWWLFGIYVGLWWLVVGLWRWPDGSVGLNLMPLFPTLIQKLQFKKRSHISAFARQN